MILSRTTEQSCIGSSGCTGAKSRESAGLVGSGAKGASSLCIAEERHGGCFRRGARECRKKKPVQLRLRKRVGGLAKSVALYRTESNADQEGLKIAFPAIEEGGGWVDELVGAGELHEEENLVGAVLV